MASMARDAWTDERLDDLNGKVDRLDDRMERGFEGMRTELRAVRGEIGEMNRSIRRQTYGLMGIMLVGFLGTIATILTQA